MTTTAWITATNCTDSNWGNTVWSNPSNGKATDGSFASVVLTNGGSSNGLVFDTFTGIDNGVLTTEVILGWEVEVKGYCTTTSGVQFALYLDTFAGGSEGFSITQPDLITSGFTTSNSTITLGSSTDDWGGIDFTGDDTRDRGWYPNDDLYAGGFKIIIYASNSSGSSQTFYIDSVRIRATYTTQLSTSATYVTAGSNIGGGTTAWTSPTSIYTDNGVYATCAIANSSATSQTLRGTTLGFSVPSTNVIDGILVNINRFGSATTSGGIRDYKIQLVKSASGVGNDKAVPGTNWPTATTTIATYGHQRDLWGWTPTYSDINDSTFGVDLKATNAHTSTSRTASVDYIQVQVFYHAPLATNVTVTPTGVYTTSAVGTPSVSISVLPVPTGVSSTTAVGTITVIPQTVVPMTGASSATNVGSFNILTSSTVTPTGVQSTSAIGSLAISLGTNALVPVIGASSTTQVGNLTPSIDVSSTLTGVSTTSAVGTPTIAIGASPTLPGVSSTTAVGTLIAGAQMEAIVPLPSIEFYGQPGFPSVSIDVQRSLTGNQTTFAVGSIAPSIDKIAPLSSVSTTSAVGTLSAQTIINATATLTGNAITSSVGTFWMGKNLTDTGWRSPTSGAYTFSGTLIDSNSSSGNWTNITNVVSSDDTYATIGSFASGAFSSAGGVGTYGFSLPSTAQPRGVLAQIEKSSTSGYTIKDYLVQLMKGGSRSGSNKADTTTPWSTTDTYTQYGASNDLWGTTLTVANVNASNFGVVISAKNETATFATDMGKVDHMQLRVYYDVPHANIALTGHAITSQVGTLHVMTSVPITGVSTTSAVGTLTAGAGQTPALTGVQTSSAIGSLVAGAGAGPIPQGVSITSSIGNLAVLAGIIIPVPSASATLTAGQMFVGSEILTPVILHSVQGNFTIGTILPGGHQIVVLEQDHSIASFAGNITIANDSKFIPPATYTTFSVGQLQASISPNPMGLSGFTVNTHTGTFQIGTGVDLPLSLPGITIGLGDIWISTDTPTETWSVHTSPDETWISINIGGTG